jgi:hypothetical protein
VTVDVKTGEVLQVESSGPKAKKVIVPVAEAAPDKVAVSEMDPPNTTGADACVVRVGAAITTAVSASALSFSEFGSDDEVITEALFV